MHIAQTYANLGWVREGEGGAQSAPIAGIADIARNRRNRKTSPLPLIHGKPGQVNTDDTDLHPGPRG